MNNHTVALKPLQLGLSFGTFLVVGFIACVALALIVPNLGLHQPWLQFLPGFTWTVVGMLIGVVESFVYGFVSGVVFASIANYFGIARSG